MSQKRTALIVCGAIRKSIDRDALYALLLDLSEIIGKAQNGPPDGESDGSIDEHLWGQLVEFRDKLSGTIRNLESLR